MSTIVRFFRNTKNSSRVLFIVWLFFSFAGAGFDSSQYMYTFPVSAVLFLLPAFIVEYRNNPVFTEARSAGKIRKLEESLANEERRKEDALHIQQLNMALDFARAEADARKATQRNQPINTEQDSEAQSYQECKAHDMTEKKRQWESGGKEKLEQWREENNCGYYRILQIEQAIDDDIKTIFNTLDPHVLFNKYSDIILKAPEYIKHTQSREAKEFLSSIIQKKESVVNAYFERCCSAEVLHNIKDTILEFYSGDLTQNNRQYMEDLLTDYCISKILPSIQDDLKIINETLDPDVLFGTYDNMLRNAKIYTKHMKSKSALSKRILIDMIQNKEQVIDTFLERCYSAGILSDIKDNMLEYYREDLTQNNLQHMERLLSNDNMTKILSAPLKYSIYNVDIMEGHEFEHFCAHLLELNGFSDVSVTKGSGDQGVDIIATKSGIKYAIQCKNYSSSLSNKPIQEVHAGKDFYHCHVGAVMTNSFFTPKAKELADATGVLTWDRSELQRMMDYANDSTNTEAASASPDADNHSNHEEIIPTGIQPLVDDYSDSIVIASDAYERFESACHKYHSRDTSIDIDYEIKRFGSHILNSGEQNSILTKQIQVKFLTFFETLKELDYNGWTDDSETIDDILKLYTGQNTIVDFFVKIKEQIQNLENTFGLNPSSFHSSQQCALNDIAQGIEYAKQAYNNLGTIIMEYRKLKSTL